ncbi:L-serine ammonia-lyase [Candidatus Woesearchaeota archaeon]|jgi:L-serine dehydratase|nr:L-serine ammonia-lyase [Candidatus Woesearchaeota archaeon]
MNSLKEFYKIGNGPSSSHTMGPKTAAKLFKEKLLTLKLASQTQSFIVTLFGSLGATGKGHLTNVAITNELKTESKKISFVWKPNKFLKFNSNALQIEALNKNKKIIHKSIFYSVGGGEIIEQANKNIRPQKKHNKSIYKLKSFSSILKKVNKKRQLLHEYVFETEPEIATHLNLVWKTMKKSISEGLKNEGILPGSLKLRRKAPGFYIKSKSTKGFLHDEHIIFSYALAVSEENASGGIVVTAPTCGSSGVLPAVLFFLQKHYKFPNKKILAALATAGLIGNLVKHNGSISGAEVGCQGEIGVACAMAAGAAAMLIGCSNEQIEHAAEMGLEHHLGLTCDPVKGLVQIPCIERNAVAADRALQCAAFAVLCDSRPRVSFDQIIQTMVETGHDLQSKYKETSKGGLAKRRI